MEFPSSVVLYLHLVANAVCYTLYTSFKCYKLFTVKYHKEQLIFTLTSICNNWCRYKMMYNHDVSTVPLSAWLASDALVGVWCTNCEQHAQDIITKWFPKWGLCHVATWYWIKVSTYLSKWLFWNLNCSKVLELKFRQKLTIKVVKLTTIINYWVRGKYTTQIQKVKHIFLLINL